MSAAEEESEGPIVCAGAPRDLGLDQGRAARDEIAREVGALGLGARIAGFWPDRAVRGTRRDLYRYYPHMAERTHGLAVGARAPMPALVTLLARELRPEAADAARCVALEAGPSGPLLAWSPPRTRPGRLRRSEPETDFQSVEWCSPWLVAASVGVNEHGLAAAIRAEAAPATGSGECHAPAILLVQDCLQRFDAVDKAVEWCERRPAGGRAEIVLVDARGDAAAVAIDGAGRRVRRPSDGLLVAGADASDARAIEKRLAGLSGPGTAAVVGALGVPEEVVVVDPVARRLERGAIRAAATRPA